MPVVYFLLLLGFWCAGSLPVAAQSSAPMGTLVEQDKTAEQQAARRQALIKDREAIERDRQNLKTQMADLPWQLETLRPEQLNEAFLDQAAVDVKSAQLHQETTATNLKNVERRIQEFQKKKIMDLEAREQLLKNPAKDVADGNAAERVTQLQQTQQMLAQQRAELELELLNLDNLRAQDEVAKLRLAAATQWQERVERLYRQLQEQSRQDAQTQLITRLQTDQAALQERASALKQRLAQGRGTLSVAAWQRLETELRIIEEQINLRTQDRYLADVDATLARLRDLLKKTEATSSELQDGLARLAVAHTNLQQTEELLQAKIALHSQQRQLIERREEPIAVHRRLRDEELHMMDRLLAELQQRLEQTQSQRTELRDIETRLVQAYQERLQRDLFMRKVYPDSAEAWQQLRQELATVPGVLFHQVRLSGESAFRAVLDQTLLGKLRLLILEGVFLWGMLRLRQGLRQAAHRLSAAIEHYPSFLTKLTHRGVQLLQAILPSVGLTLAFLILLKLIDMPQPGLWILVTLALLWVGVRFSMSLTWLLLAAPSLPETQRHLPLYHQLFWTSIGAGILAALVILVDLSDLPVAVTDVFSQIFMLYWFWAFVPLLRVRRLIIERFSAAHSDRIGFAVLRSGSLLLPLSLLVAAIMGLLGYLQLAWLTASYLLIFLAVLVSALILRSLLNDLVVVLKNYAIAHSGYGLLWTQDVIAPLHRIVNLLLFMGAGFILFWAYGWTADSTVIAGFWTALEWPLWTFGGTAITPWRIAVTLTVLLLVVWLGQWTRAVMYRWILSHISDLGIRHSLSVFTQYTIVLLGGVLLLRLVGIDLTTLAVFAGAVGVGIGLGMQNLANNFISGLLLLIERPLRRGDIVQVGTHLGEVIRIGMRALTVQTFDNESVIIPNSEVIGHAFINWTHSDRIRRTVLWVGISYEADPYQAREVIKKVLAEHPAILEDPEPLALLWDFADSAMKFRIQYYIDLSQNSLLKVQDEVLFAIWNRFKESDIGIPYPQRDLYIKSWPGMTELREPMSGFRGTEKPMQRAQ